MDKQHTPFVKRIVLKIFVQNSLSMTKSHAKHTKVYYGVRDNSCPLNIPY